MTRAEANVKTWQDPVTRQRRSVGVSKALLKGTSDADDDDALLSFATASASKALGKEGSDAE